MNPTLGNFHSLVQSLEAQCARPFSYLDERWTASEEWHRKARDRVAELLAYSPPSLPLDARVEEVTEDEGLVVERITWAQPHGPRTEAYLLRPADAKGPLPGVVALHDHSGYYFWGKEKVVGLPGEPGSVTALKEAEYGGRSWANDLARRGYVVLAHDVFLWGSRKLDPASLPAEAVASLAGLPPGSEEYLKTYHQMMYPYETLVAKSLFLSGSTWPGIMAWEDRRAVDYLAGRPEVDATRLGCGGLSGGGLRSLVLAALDPRIRTAVVAGFMSTAAEVLADKIARHTWMFHLPGLSALMDLPDLASLHGPLPLLVQYDSDDPLWTLTGQTQADERLARVYAKLGAPKAYEGRFYPGPHKFDRPMQADAFDWFDRWLAP